jgi:hypothetical protein
MSRVSGTGLISILIVTWLFVITTCVSAKTFHGRVIDADTKEPIEGAVVVAYWYKARTTLLGEEDVTLKDVKEALTDKNGQWAVTGPKGREHDVFPYFSTITGIYYTQPPLFIVFKPGYCSWPEGFSIDACKSKIKPEGSGRVTEGKTIELPKLTNREDRLKAQRISEIYPSSDDPKVIRKYLKKQLELLRLLDEERRNLGLSEYKIYEELKNEK